MATAPAGESKTTEGRLLRIWRERIGISQDELGARVVAGTAEDGTPKAMDGSLLSVYERGKSSPTVRQLLQILPALQIPGDTEQERLARFFAGPDTVLGENPFAGIAIEEGEYIVTRRVSLELTTGTVLAVIEVMDGVAPWPTAKARVIATFEELAQILRGPSGGAHPPIGRPRAPRQIRRKPGLGDTPFHEEDDDPEPFEGGAI